MSNRLFFLVNSGCKRFASFQQCFKGSLFSNEKLLSCHRVNSIAQLKIIRTFSCFNCEPFRHKSVDDQFRTTLHSPRFANPNHLICNYFSNQVDKNEKKEEKQSLYQKLKIMYKNYWYVLVPVHLVTSAFWFGGFYYMVASGIDIASLMEAANFPASWVETFRSSKAGNIVAAYTLYKIATPARYTVTLGGTTISINYLKKWGWIKPVPNKEAIKKMYEEQKGALKDLKMSYQGKMQVKKNELLKTKEEMKQQYKEAKEELERSVLETQKGFKQNVEEISSELRGLRRLINQTVKEKTIGNKKPDK